MLNHEIEPNPDQPSVRIIQKKQEQKTFVKTDKNKPVVSSENDHLRQMQQQHQEAKKRLSQIKDQVKKLEDQQKTLEAESYAKTRKLSELYSSSSNTELIKEYSQRLKEIQSQLRDIETTILNLWEEKEKIEKRVA